jgi:hypothetical protein
MATHLNQVQDQLLALQEKGFLADLTAEEQAFVLSQMTQAAFDQAHRIISESKDLYTAPAARPLVLPAAAPQRFGSMLAPLASAAAAAALTYFFFLKETVIVRTVEKPIYLTADTVYLKNNKIDTVIAYREGKTKYIQEKSTAHLNVELSEESKSNELLPPLSTLDLKNRGHSMREDKTFDIMDGLYTSKSSPLDNLKQ